MASCATSLRHAPNIFCNHRAGCPRPIDTSLLLRRIIWILVISRTERGDLTGCGLQVSQRPQKARMLGHTWAYAMLERIMLLLPLPVISSLPFPDKTGKTPPLAGHVVILGNMS